MRRRPVLALALCLGLTLVPGVPARAQTTFTFYGSGWGHGIGLSQWGAYGLATQGWEAGKIVRHYYKGTSVGQQAPPARRFRIGLLQYQDHARLRAEQKSFRLVLANGRVLSRVKQGQVRVVLISRTADGRDIYVVKNGRGRVVGRGGSASNHLMAKRAKGAVIRVEESRWPHMVARGSLQFNIVGPASAHLVAIVGAERYLFGLAEVPSSWDEDALDAQAIAARSYAWEKIRRLKQHRSGCNCGLFATTVDQYYVGWDAEVALMGDRWVAAVRRTARTVALHDGAPIPAYYSAASGGHTEHIQNVWVGAAPAPYLRGVCDPAEWDVTAPNDKTKVLERWSASFSASALTSRLGLGIGTVRKFRGWNRGVSGRVTSVTVVGTNGSASVSGWTMRSRLGLRDTKFWVNSNRTITGRIRQRYDNLSCRPGIPRSPRLWISGGKLQKFETGRLYLHGKRSVVTWVRGPVLSKYLAKRGHRGFLKLPYRWRAIDGGGGRRVLFDGGEILWQRSQPEAFEVHGPVLATYLAEGGFPALGYPLTDVIRAPDALTLSSDFQQGTITCTRADTESPWECSRS